MVLEDGISFRSGQHDGYLKSIQKWMDIAIQLSFVPDLKTLHQMSPSHQTIGREVSRQCAEFKKERDASLAVLSRSSCPAISFSLDLWTDKGFKHHWLGVMATTLSEDKLSLNEFCS